MSAKKIARSAIIAAMYVSLTLLLQPFAYGPLQFRVSEFLTILPCLMIEGVWGVTLGCVIANFFTPMGFIDMIFGPLITLVAAILTRRLRRRPWLAAMPPVLLNALFLPVIFLVMEADVVYWIAFFELLISQGVIVYGIGLPVYYALRPFKKLYS